MKECRTSGILFLFIFASQCIKALYTGITLFFKLFPFSVHPENALKPSVCIDFDHYNSG
jgi:hypothetical protein